MIIEWSQMPWNPIKGCKTRSEGCRHCWANTRAKTLQERGDPKYRNGFKLEVFEYPFHFDFEKLPPTRIFAGSMTDFFQDEIPEEYIIRVFYVILSNPKHLFLISTKFVERMHAMSSRLPWPVNLLMVVTVEHEKYKYRIDLLRDTGAHHKAIFFEPLLSDMGEVNLEGIGWAFVGGESGPGFRAVQESWIRNLKSECDRQGCEFIFKQWGGHPRESIDARLDGRYYGRIPGVEIIQGDNSEAFT